MMKTQLTREGKERLVVELYNQRKPYAQIAKEAHVSLRDIGPILSKAGIQQNQSVKSRALELYSQQKNPLEVAIALSVDADEAITLHREYYMLLGCGEFARVYPEIKDDPWPIVNLVKAVRKEQMDTNHVMRLLHIANNDLPSVESRLQELERNKSIIDSNYRRAARNLNELNDHISKEKVSYEQYHSTSIQLNEEIKNLRVEKIKVENAISSIKINNETSIKIKEIVKQQMESLQPNLRKQLRCAIASIFQSETNHPGKLRTLYYNNPPTLSLEQILSISQIEQYPGQHEDSLEKLILDEAEQVLSRIVESLANICMNEIKDTSVMLPISNMLSDPSLDERKDADPDDLDTISISELISRKFVRISSP